MRKKKGKSAKRAQSSQGDVQELQAKQAPHSFVFHRGQVGKNVRHLVLDVRRIMEPYTAVKLKVRKKNVLKDFVNIAGVLNVTHFIVFTKSDVSTNMKLMRLPRGPTLTFKVHGYCFSRDVLSAQRRPNVELRQYQHHPLLVMNNFSGDGMHLKLMTTMFQNMFPSINVNKVKLDSIKRCVLIDYDQETKMIDLRHYNIRVVPTGMSRGIKKLIKSKLPDLGKYEDISEYVDKGGNLSESEAEMDGDFNKVTLPQKMTGRGNTKLSQSAIRLKEVGPRLKLQLVKIEEGICSGQVMFHEFVEKTSGDLKSLKKLREQKKLLKLKRKKEQAENVRKKQEAKEAHKAKSLAGMADAQETSKTEDVEKSASEVSEDDDAAYYEKEVGIAPDPDLFLNKKPHLKRKRKMSDNFPGKRFKKDKFDKTNRNKNVKGDKSSDKKFRGKPLKGDHSSKPGKRFKGDKSSGSHGNKMAKNKNEKHFQKDRSDPKKKFNKNRRDNDTDRPRKPGSKTFSGKRKERPPPRGKNSGKRKTSFKPKRNR
ncbi:suppressor of SWI4 1 homolog [Gigantopelta aegis]|uniref:suppressor of SWI4 1 homolog n=1 Tax=Gigantopelta aegis TaxID=1735272 RepID=UPI001B88BF3A|nr:suppressor of SWI4 1 homolog [Gigantopelta aegis]